MSSSMFGVAFDARDAQVAANFWAAVLGRTVADGATSDNALINADPAIPGLRISSTASPRARRSRTGCTST